MINTNKIKYKSEKVKTAVENYLAIMDYSEDESLLEMDLIQRENPDIDFAFYAV